ncbi:MAG: hypothetical protein H6838_10715 [Planctomycetes bacterium]|nr:hypothetical protein [Planctomycetota bacterium]MCB9885958.1 hypothetical protein [Planctomycetota bacterium]
MTRSSSLLPGVVLLAAGVAAWLWWPRGDAPRLDDPAAPAPVAAHVPEAPAPAVGAVAPSQPVVERPAAPTAKVGVMKFPDGSKVAALNGVTADVDLVWNDRPYSPIKEKIVDRGWEWYVHEDGSHSTVRMVEVNGVLAPIGLVASPTETLPVLDELDEQLRQQLPQRR